MAGSRIFLSPPYLDGNERRYVESAFDSNYIAPCGPMVDAFEKDFSAVTGIENAVALSSATAALDLLFARLGVGAGDTVFCSDLTFVASIGPAVHRGASPVFIDCDEATWTMSPDLLGEALRNAAAKGMLPKAVVAVDLYGQCCDYAAIEPICESFGVPLVVDAAEALGSRFTDASGRERSAGDAGVAAAFSFNGNKIITTSGGGMLASNDAALVADARTLSQQARDPFPWYEHSRVGYNYRMSNIVAAIGRGQLERLEAKVQRKREIFDSYRRLFSDLPQISFMPEAQYCRSNRWLTVVTVDPSCGIVPETIRLALDAENIESRPLWKPMHLQPVFKDAAIFGGAVGGRLFREGLCLPSGAGMSDSDVKRVSDAVHSVFIKAGVK